MLTVSACRPDHILDPALAEKVERPAPAETGVAGQHEVHPHPRVIDDERVHDLPDPWQQANVVELRGGKEPAVIHIDPEERQTSEVTWAETEMIRKRLCR